VGAIKRLKVNVDRDKILTANFSRLSVESASVAPTSEIAGGYTVESSSVASKRETGYDYSDDFSLGIRFGTLMINNIIPGLGSMILMQDYGGGTAIFFAIGCKQRRRF